MNSCNCTTAGDALSKHLWWISWYIANINFSCSWWNDCDRQYLSYLDNCTFYIRMINCHMWACRWNMLSKCDVHVFNTKRHNKCQGHMYHWHHIEFPWLSNILVVEPLRWTLLQRNNPRPESQSRWLSICSNQPDTVTPMSGNDVPVLTVCKDNQCAATSEPFHKGSKSSWFNSWR